MLYCFAYIKCTFESLHGFNSRYGNIVCLACNYVVELEVSGKGRKCRDCVTDIHGLGNVLSVVIVHVS